jgi:hypothetical protein
MLHRKLPIGQRFSSEIGNASIIDDKTLINCTGDNVESPWVEVEQFGVCQHDLTRSLQ